MRAHAHEDIMLPRPHAFLDFDQEAPSFAISCSLVGSAHRELPGSRGISDFTRYPLVIQSTGLCDIRVRVRCISSSMERKIQVLIRITTLAEGYGSI